MSSRLYLCLIVASAFCAVALAQEECKCPSLPTGKWKVDFAEVVAPGFRKTGTLKMKHLYNEAYYGTVALPNIVPLAPGFSMDFMGYLNGTSCDFRGSMAFVILRHTLAFSVAFDGTKEAKGYYHRVTAFKVDDHFAGVTMSFVSNDADALLEDSEAVADEYEGDQMPNGVQYVV